MKKVLKIIIIAILIIAIPIAGGLFYLANGLEKGQNTEVNGLNITDISDGTYEGTYKAGRWTNKLIVEIKGKKIVNISIVDDVNFPMPDLSGEVFDKVIEKQDTTVDIKAGATVTTKAYLKSIENAINNN